MTTRRAARSGGSARRQARRSTPSGPGGVPVELLAGPCVEVWGPGPGERPPKYHTSPAWRAHRAWWRFKDARRDWLDAHGFDPTDQESWPGPLRGGTMPPYSLDYLRERDPEYAVDLLAWRGLPADWQPIRAR